MCETDIAAVIYNETLRRDAWIISWVIYNELSNIRSYPVGLDRGYPVLSSYVCRSEMAIVYLTNYKTISESHFTILSFTMVTLLSRHH